MTASLRSVELAEAAAAAAADKLASDIVILDVSDQLVITDCFVLASAPNERQVLSICTLRADSYGRLSAYPQFAELLSRSHALVGPIVMRRLMFSEPFDPKQVPALVDQVLPPGPRG